MPEVTRVPISELTLSNGNIGEVKDAAAREAIASISEDVGGKLNSTLKGAVNGLAELDANGKVPSSQLPSYVDDVLEYASKNSFPSTGESGKIYVATDTNKTYRWSGTAYVEITTSLALGETSSTAYRGDRGKTAYDHASSKGSAFASGLYKITTNDQGHVTAAAAVEKADITALGIPAQDTTYSAATTSASGLMSSTDKAKLDGIAAGATANTGTITGITMNGASKGTSGVVDLGTVITSHQDISGKVSGPSSSTNAHVAVFDGTTGKAIKDSGYTIAKSVPSDAKFTDTTYSAATTSAAGLMSSTDKTKLDGIAAGAQVNPGNATTSAAGLMSATDKTKLDGIASGATANTGTITGITMNGASKGTSGVVDLGTVITSHQDISGKVSGPSSSTDAHVAVFNGTTGKTIKDSGYTIAKSVPSDAKFTDTTYSAATTSAAGLMSSTDKAKLDGIASGATANTGTITGITMNGASKGTSGVVNLGTVITAHQDISGKLNSSLKGAANGLAELDANGKVPSSQLPSFVDDVLEYDDSSSFPTTGETGKIYVAKDTNKTYRWSGTAYVEISPSLALGETSSTAYRGDRGKTAYDHASAKGSAFSSGLYKITTNAQGHVTAATAVAKSDITGLGIPGQDTTYSAATTSAAGLMSSTDKTKLDGIASGATANTGTITGITMNGASKGTSGVVDLGTVITSHQDISGKVSGPSSSTDAHVAVFNGTTGKAIKDSGYTIAKSVPSDAKFTDTTYSAATTSAAGLMSADDKTKLNGIAAGAQVNPGNATTSAAGLMSSTDKAKLDGIASGATANTGTITGITMNGASKGTSGVVDLGTVITSHQDISGKVSGPSSAANARVAVFDGTTGKAIKDSGYTIAKSVPSDAKFTDTTYSAATTSAAGLMSSTDKAKLDGIAAGATANTGTITGIKMNGASKGTSGVVDLGTVITAHQDISGKLNSSLKGVANGLAELDANGKVPSSQLPSFVDDVLEYTSSSSFPSTGETGKIYVTTDTNKTYRWSGTAYVEISASLALGETSSTAYRGDRGKTAYDHASAKGSAFSSGLYKITTNAQGHVTAATAVVKSDITGLGIPGQDTTYSAATTSAAGLMSADDKTKLNGIASGATANTGTITGIKMNGASKGTSGVVDLGTVITSHQDISGKVSGPSSAVNARVAVFDGTTGKAIKDSGYTIAKSVPSDAKFTDTTYSAATTSAAGLMSADDKTKLNGIASGAQVNPGNATTSAAGLMSAEDKTKLNGIATGATANTGTITGIKMNGASKGTSGVVDLGTVITSHQDISGKVSGPSSATNTHVAVFDGTTGKAIKDSGYTIAKSVPSDAKFTDTTYSAATTSAAGLMSSTDKAKLDGIGTIPVVTNCNSLDQVKAYLDGVFNTMSTYDVKNISFYTSQSYTGGVFHERMNYYGTMIRRANDQYAFEVRNWKGETIEGGKDGSTYEFIALSDNILALNSKIVGDSIVVTDYNDMTNPGTYRARESSQAINIPNPSVPGRHYVLSVFTNSDNNIMQIAYTPKDGGCTYTRGKLSEDNTWSSWRQLNTWPYLTGTPAKTEITAATDNVSRNVSCTANCIMVFDFHVVASTNGAVSIGMGTTNIINQQSNGACNYWVSVAIPVKANTNVSYKLSTNASDSKIRFLDLIGA